MVGNAGIKVSGAAGETCGRYTQLGIPGLVMADGSAGLRLNRKYSVDEQGIFLRRMEKLEEGLSRIPNKR